MQITNAIQDKILKNIEVITRKDLYILVLANKEQYISLDIDIKLD